jgi:hypothetical protein
MNYAPAYAPQYATSYAPQYAPQYPMAPYTGADVIPAPNTQPPAKPSPLSKEFWKETTFGFPRWALAGGVTALGLIALGWSRGWFDGTTRRTTTRRTSTVRRDPARKRSRKGGHRRHRGGSHHHRHAFDF